MGSKPGHRETHTQSTAEAATALGVHPQMLRLWVQQFGFPDAQVIDGRRRFAPQQIAAIHAALAEQSTVEEAIATARLALRTQDLVRHRDGRTRVQHWRVVGRRRAAQAGRAAMVLVFLVGSLAGAPSAAALLRSRSTGNPTKGREGLLPGSQRSNEQSGPN